MYIGLKDTHITIMIISVILFELRYLLKVMNRPFDRFLKVAPHVIDTMLLITGVSLAQMAGFVPWDHSWLGVKLLALVLYIILGSIALKSKGAVSVWSFLFATLTVSYMIMVAVTKNPWFFGAG